MNSTKLKAFYQRFLCKMNKMSFSRNIFAILPLLKLYKYFHFLKKDLREAVLIVDHNIGGGANFYRNSLKDEFIAESLAVILLYYDLALHCYKLQIDIAGQQYLMNLYSLEKIIKLCQKVRLKKIIFNHCYTFKNPLALLPVLSKIKNLKNIDLIVAVHDYFAICPSYNLLDYNNKFCNIPTLSFCQKCLPKNNGEFSGVVDCKDIIKWRDSWGGFLQLATKIICFSESSKQLLLKAYPFLSVNQFTIQPHEINYLPANKPVINLRTQLNIGVVGYLHFHKGLEIIEEMGKLIARENLPIKITLIGGSARSLVTDIVKDVGPYKRESLVEIIENSGANIFFMPSICPETFSYVTAELMQLDVPLAVFDLGAPPERVANYPKGLVIREIDAAAALHAIINFHKKLLAQEEQR